VRAVEPHEPPTVTEISPGAGPAESETAVTFTGTEMDTVTSVRFNTLLATDLEHLSPTSIRVLTPKAQGTKKIGVEVVDDLGDEVFAGYYEYVRRPEVLKLSVKKGPASGGTSVLIEARDQRKFEKVTEVLFGSTSATIESEAPLIVRSPGGTAGKVPVTVVSPGGASAPSKQATFDYVGPVVNSVGPASGPRAGGDAVTVTGAGFAAGAAATSFVFGKTTAGGVDCVSDTECTMVVPAAAKASTVDVRASVGKAKSKKSASDQYTYE
jgi:hypothetical protein